MGLMKGVDAIRQATESKPRSAFNWFKLGDGEAVRVRFAQELDYNSPSYVEENGVGVMVRVIQPPTKDGWKHRFYVTDETEHLLEEVEDWEKKTRLFINVVVERDGEWNLELWDASKSTAKTLLEYSAEEGAITDYVYKVRRSGSGRDTTYILLPQPKAETPDLDEFDLVDIENVILKELNEKDIAKFNEEAAGDAEDDTSDSVGWMDDDE